MTRSMKSTMAVVVLWLIIVGSLAASVSPAVEETTGVNAEGAGRTSVSKYDGDDNNNNNNDDNHQHGVVKLDNVSLSEPEKDDLIRENNRSREKAVDSTTRKRNEKESDDSLLGADDNNDNNNDDGDVLRNDDDDDGDGKRVGDSIDHDGGVDDDGVTEKDLSGFRRRNYGNDSANGNDDDDDGTVSNNGTAGAIDSNETRTNNNDTAVEEGTSESASNASTTSTSDDDNNNNVSTPTSSPTPSPTPTPSPSVFVDPRQFEGDDDSAAACPFMRRGGGGGNEMTNNYDDDEDIDDANLTPDRRRHPPTASSDVVVVDPPSPPLIPCSELPVECLNCTLDYACVYGHDVTVSCSVIKDDAADAADVVVDCLGDRTFDREMKCRYCFQTKFGEEHVCALRNGPPPTSASASASTPGGGSGSAGCHVKKSPTSQSRFKTNCTVRSHVLCLGRRNFYKMLPCNWTSGYRWTTTLILSVFLGGFGADRFYLAQWKEGIGKLFSFGGLGIWTVIDVILISIGYIGPQDGSLYIY